MKILLIIFCLIAIKTYSQDLKLSVDYLEPRIGQIIELTFKPSFLNKYISDQLPAGLIEHSQYGSDNLFRYTLKAKDLGEQQIGPFEFTFNNSQYKTDSILINVKEELPLKEGLWIRSYKNEKSVFIIIEEQLSQQKDKNLDDYQLVGLNEILSDDLIVSCISSFKTPLKAGTNYDSPTLIYSRSIYSTQNKTTNEIKVNKKFYKNLPNGFELPKINLPGQIETSNNNNKDLSFSIFNQKCILLDSSIVEMKIKFMHSVKNFDKVESEYGYTKHSQLTLTEVKALIHRVCSRINIKDAKIEVLNALIETEIKKEKKLWQRYYLDTVIIEILDIK